MIYLISSVILFNTTSLVGEKGISELSLLNDMDDSIMSLKISDLEKERLINKVQPKLIWVIRDIGSVQLKDDEGNFVSNKEYFEICLLKKVN